MRILFVAPRFHTNQQGWVETLQTAGHDVRFIVFHTIPAAEDYHWLTPITADTLPLPRIICSGIDFILKLQGKLPREHFHRIPDYRKLKQKILTLKPDLIIVRDLTYPLSLASLYIAKRYNIPSILYNQLPMESKEPLSTRFFRRIGIAPDVRVTPSRTSTLEHNKTTNALYLPLITNFTHTQNKRDYVPNGTLRILTIGKLHLERKKLRLLVETLAKIKNTLNFSVTIAGALNNPHDTEFIKLQKTIAEHGLSEKITIKANVPYRDMSALFLAHDIFILPSINEPYAISPLEAMNFGLPVIITDSNGSRGQVINHKTGFIIKSNDEHSLIEAIRHVTEIKLRVMGDAAYNAWQQQFSPQAFNHYFSILIGYMGITKK